jgi:hypothetical protein
MEQLQCETPHLVNSPQSPLYTGPQEPVAANLDVIIAPQKSDGGWGLLGHGKSAIPQPGN